MTAIDLTINPSPDSPCLDCDAFLNWSEQKLGSEHERAVVFQSLIATLKLQPELDDSLETKAVKLLRSVHPRTQSLTGAFLNSLQSSSGNSSPDFVQSIVVFVSAASHVIKTAAMEMLQRLLATISPEVLLALVQADLITQLIINLNPQSLSFAKAVDIHLHLMNIARSSLKLATPDGLEQLKITDQNEHQVVHDTILKQVMKHSEQYIGHLCVNRFSIVDGEISFYIRDLIVHLLRICPCSQPTMDFIIDMPVSRSMVTTLSFSFAATLALLALLRCGIQCVNVDILVKLRCIARTKK
ncbi:hypothetical protein BLNAU_7507 [Blattamonas nauphoetae]|uniref:Uncharacterized protein n=1 Tax=Blattamonas nauphoetae TaxID=2049346 RepID=A0ABQ9Y1M0_9EUKA|nr:hypothetical protein BLNAU_7507 [Blattamonas nauphoetae]